MDLTAFLDGFALVVEPKNLLYCLVGVLIGMIIGVLPGLGPAATIAILLPITYTIDPVSAIIMLAGIYYGAQYGGTITSVLLRLPGEASSVVTVFDGFALAKQGKAGTALGIAAIGSFVGATISIIGLTLLAPVVASIALDFGPPEYAALALLGVLLVATIGSGNKLKALIAGTVGLLLATVGRDSFTGASRFTFDSLALADGIDFVVVAMGLFGVGEILYNLEQRHGKKHVPAEVGNVWPSRKDLKQSSGAIGRGSIIGFVLGVLPGGGAVLSSIVAYATEKRRSKTPERFGRGAIEGVAAPETRQQRRGHLVVHPAAHHRPARQRDDGDAVRRAADPRRLTRPAVGRRTSGRLLGRHQLDVHRQHPAADPVHPAGRIVRADPQGPARDPRADHRADHDPRRVHHQQLGVRHLPDGGLRHHRLPDEEGGIRSRSDGAGIRPRIHHRVEHATVPAHLRRRPNGIRDPADLRRHPGGLRVADPAPHDPNAVEAPRVSACRAGGGSWRGGRASRHGRRRGHRRGRRRRCCRAPAGPGRRARRR